MEINFRKTNAFVMSKSHIIVEFIFDYEKFINYEILIYNQNINVQSSSLSEKEKKIKEMSNEK